MMKMYEWFANDLKKLSPALQDGTGAGIEGGAASGF
jgi:hypothetical protein